MRTNPHFTSVKKLKDAVGDGARVRVVAGGGGGDVSQKFVDLPIGKSVVRVQLDGQNYIAGFPK